MAGRKLTDEERAERSRKAVERLALKRAQQEAERVASAESSGGEEVAVASGEVRPTLGDVAQERRARLLGAVDPETAALITDEELAQIEREEHERALNERKKRALADIRASAKQLAHVEHALIPASVLRTEEERARLSEKIEVRFQLPSEGTSLPSFRVDGRLVLSGEWTPMTRAEYESLLPNWYQCWLAEFMFTTMDQHKPGHSAKEVMGQMLRPPDVRTYHAA